MSPAKTQPKKAKADGSVKSAARVLSIFEYFERTRAPRTLSEISQDLKYPVSSTLALLRSIQASGYLNYDFDKKAYFPSHSFAMLGHWIHDQLLQGGAVQRMMEHLAAVTEETVLLALQNGLHAQHIHIVDTAQSLRYAPPIGTMRPLLRSAAGKVLLSLQERAAILRIVERINSLGADGGRKYDPKAVVAELEDVRAKGYAYSANVFTPGAAMVAVPLPRHLGDLPMVLSVGGPYNRIDEAAIPKLIKQMHKVIAEYLPDTDGAATKA